VIRKTSGSAYVAFRDLAIGQHFNMKGAGPGIAPRKKVSAKCYAYPTSENVKVKRRGKITGKPYFPYVKRKAVRRYCYSGAPGLNTLVQPTGRRSPVKRRTGRSRGRAVLAGTR
jgi:hypothetical protein